MYMLRILSNETGKTNSGELKRAKRLITDNQEAYGHVLHLGQIFGMPVIPSWGVTVQGKLQAHVNLTIQGFSQLSLDVQNLKAVVSCHKLALEEDTAMY